MIKSSGFRISPSEVEEALFSSGKLSGAAVIGIPDEVLGQTIKAFVVLRNGENTGPANFAFSLCGASTTIHGSQKLGDLKRTSEDLQRQSRLSCLATA